jgi:DNA-binding MarR family transcriptional regulator
LNLPFDPIERAAERWEETWGSASAMRVATSIMRAQQILLGRYDELLKPHGLTFARYEVLVLLRFSRYGALPLGRIGERLMVHPTSVTNSIDRLEKARFVERRPNPRDGRGTLAAITRTGLAVVEVATKDLMDADFGLGSLRERDRANVVSALRTLRLVTGDFTSAERADPPSTHGPNG